VDEVRNTAGETPEGREQIKVDQSSVDVSYSNFVVVSTGVEEIALMFGLRTPDDSPVKITDKIVLSPKNAKRCALALSQAIKAYEERFAAIDITVQAPREQSKK
jgi:hypothetical protein